MPSKDRKKAQEKKIENQERRSGQSTSESTSAVDMSSRPTGVSKSSAQRQSASEKGVRAVQEIKAEKQECQVCNEQIEDNALILPCKHAFHPHHLIDSFIENEDSDCPVCGELAHVCVQCAKNIRGEGQQLKCGHYMHTNEYSRLIKTDSRPNCPACQKSHTSFCILCRLPKQLDRYTKLDCGHRIHDDHEYLQWLETSRKCPICNTGATKKCILCEVIVEDGHIDISCHCDLMVHPDELEKWLITHDGKCPQCQLTHPNFCFVCNHLFDARQREAEIRLECCDTKYHKSHLDTWLAENGQTCPQCKHLIGGNYQPVLIRGGSHMYTRTFCEICGDYTYDHRDQFQLECCGKKYHYICLEAWLKSKGGKCPECHKDVPDIGPHPDKAKRCKKCMFLLGPNSVNMFDDHPYCLECLKIKMEDDVDFEYCYFCPEQVYDAEKMSHAEINEAKNGKHLGYCKKCSWKRKIGFFFNGDECQCETCPPKHCKKLFRRTDWTKQICVQCNTALGDDSHIIMLMCGDIFHKKCYLELRKKGRVICPKCEYQPDYCMHCDFPSAIFDSDQEICYPSITMGCCKKTYNAMHLYNALGGCLASKIKCPNCQKKLPFKAAELQKYTKELAQRIWKQTDPNFYLGNLVLNSRRQNRDTFPIMKLIGESLYKDEEKWDDLCIINENRALVNGIDIKTIYGHIGKGEKRESKGKKVHCGRCKEEGKKQGKCEHCKFVASFYADMFDDEKEIKATKDLSIVHSDGSLKHCENDGCYECVRTWTRLDGKYYCHHCFDDGFWQNDAGQRRCAKCLQFKASAIYDWLCDECLIVIQDQKAANYSAPGPSNTSSQSGPSKPGKVESDKDEYVSGTQCPVCFEQFCEHRCDYCTKYHHSVGIEQMCDKCFEKRSKERKMAQ